MRQCAFALNPILMTDKQAFYHKAKSSVPDSLAVNYSIISTVYQQHQN